MTVWYNIDWFVDPYGGFLRGTTEVTIRADAETSADSISLLLNRCQRVSEVCGPDGSSIAVQQYVAADPVYSDGELEYLVNRIDIPLPFPLPPRREITLSIEHSGSLESGGRVLPYVKDRICEDFTLLRDETHPYPVIAGVWQPSERFGYHLAVTVPDGYVAACGGIPGSVVSESGCKTYHYSMPPPRWRLDVAIGKLEIVGSRNSGTVVYCEPAYRDSAAETVRKATEALGLCRKWWGPPKVSLPLTILQIPEGYGSQADPPVLILAAEGFRGANWRGLYHEIAHIYNPACDRNPARWMSEGFATFIADLIVHKFGQRSSQLASAMRKLREQLLELSVRIPEMETLPLDEYHRLPETQPAYALGGLAFYVLYLAVGSDRFHKIIRALYSEYGDNPCDIAEWLACAERAVGCSLEQWARDWILTNHCWRMLRGKKSLKQAAGRYRVTPRMQP